MGVYLLVVCVHYEYCWGSVSVCERRNKTSKAR